MENQQLFDQPSAEGSELTQTHTSQQQDQNQEATHVQEHNDNDNDSINREDSLLIDDDFEESSLLKEINSALAKQEELEQNEQQQKENENNEVPEPTVNFETEKTMDPEPVAGTKRLDVSSHYDEHSSQAKRHASESNGKDHLIDMTQLDRPESFSNHEENGAADGTQKDLHNDDDPYSSALMEINDTEQLEFLANQLKTTDSSMATTQPQHRQQSQLRSNSQTNSYSHTSRSYTPPPTHTDSLHTSNHQSPPAYQTSSHSSVSVPDQNEYPGHYQHFPQQHSQHEQGSNYLEYLMGDPITNLRVRSIPILDNLATQILNTLTKPSHLDSLGIATSPETAEGQAFQVLVSLFTQTKTIYSDSEFINVDAIGLHNDNYCRQIVQKSNLATFVAALFGVYPMSFYLLDYHFLDVFVYPGSRLLKLQAALYLDLKTQAYIVTVQQRDDPKEMVLNNTFPDNIEQVLLARRNTKVLVPSEADFVQRVKRRKEHLSALPADADLSQKYQWLTFLRDIADYVNRNLSVILTGRAQTKSSGSSVSASFNKNGNATKASSRKKDDPISYISAAVSDAPAKNSTLSKSLGLSMVTEDSELLISESEYESANASSVPVGDDGKGNEAEGNATTSSTFAGNNLTSTSTDPVQQTPIPASSIVSASSSAITGRSGFFQRRTWTAEEEAALLEGLNRVNGPYWSKILDMYGPGGTVSEVLKDRNQVQLKDKARNLKLYYLKANMPIPPVLQTVTGHANRGEKTGKRGKRGRGGARGGSRATSSITHASATGNSTSKATSGTQSKIQTSVPSSSQPQPQTSLSASSSQSQFQHSPLTTLSYVASNQLQSSQNPPQTQTSSASPISAPASESIQTTQAPQPNSENASLSPIKTTFSSQYNSTSISPSPVSTTLSVSSTSSISYPATTSTALPIQSEATSSAYKPSGLSDAAQKHTPVIISSSKEQQNTEKSDTSKPKTNTTTVTTAGSESSEAHAGEDSVDVNDEPVISSLDSLMKEVGAYISSEEKKDSDFDKEGGKANKTHDENANNNEKVDNTAQPVSSSSEEQVVVGETPNKISSNDNDLESDFKPQTSSKGKNGDTKPNEIPQGSQSGSNSGDVADPDMDVDEEAALRNEAELLLQNLMDQDLEGEEAQTENPNGTSEQSANVNTQEPNQGSSTTTTENTTSTLASASTALSELQSAEPHSTSTFQEDEDGDISMDVLEDLVQTVHGLNEEEDDNVSRAMRAVQEAISREEGTQNAEPSEASK